MTNSKIQFYTIGYTGRKPAALKQLVESQNAFLVDIRFSARSRAPQWNLSALSKLLEKRYVHLRDFGNANYRIEGAPIQLVNPERGLALIPKTYPVVFLMCGCKSPAECHRTNVARWLENRGFKVKEWLDPFPMRLEFL